METTIAIAAVLATYFCVAVGATLPHHRGSKALPDSGLNGCTEGSAYGNLQDTACAWLFARK
jgi:hypothetical protein